GGVDDDVTLENLSGYNWGSSNSCNSRDWMDMSYTAWGGNDASYGNSFAASNFDFDIDMSQSFWDVYNCPEEDVTEVWVDIDEEIDVDYSYGVGDLCSITEDVWVSIDGDDNDLGTSEVEAFLTIERAVEMIAPEDDDPITIFLTEGTFAPSTTGEEFAIIMVSNVNLIGEGEDVTILDAEQTNRVITMENCNNNIISDLTIIGGLPTASGNFDANSFGGGMYLSASNPTLNNVTITGNTGLSKGGG
ncbi:uncharacterized protein METZ01_LOCUS469692, partial [marine metagenome]